MGENDQKAILHFIYAGDTALISNSVIQVLFRRHLETMLWRCWKENPYEGGSGGKRKMLERGGM